MRKVLLAVAVACCVRVAGAAVSSVPYEWNNAQVVGGGFVSGIVFHPTARDVLYCRTDIGGAYRWNAQANRWESISDWIDADHWNYTGTESLALDPHDPQRVYVAGGTYTSAWAGNGAILRSKDQGHTWQVFPLPFKLGGNEDGRNNGERLAVDPNDGNVLYLASRRDGLWTSSDAGENWVQVKSFPVHADRHGQGLVYAMFDAASGSEGKATPNIFVGSSVDSPLYESTDGGQTWRDVPGGPKKMLPHRAAWGDNRRLLLTYGDEAGPNGNSNGSVWALDAQKLEWTDITPLKPSADDHFGYSGVTVDARHPETIVVSTLDRWSHGDDLFRSNDDGKTWNSVGSTAMRDDSSAPWLSFHEAKIPNGPLGHWIAQVAIDPFNRDRALFTTGWGIWATSDLTASDTHASTHWVPGAVGVEELVVNQVISPTSGAPVLSAVWDVDGFRHDPLDRSPAAGCFQPFVGRDTSIDFAQDKPDVMARVYGGQVLGHDGQMSGGAVSGDNGVTWHAFATRPGTAIDGTIAVSADGATLLWSPENAGAVLSHDLGATWKAVSGLPRKCNVISDRTDAGSFYGVEPETGQIFTSSDGGATFTKAGSVPRKEVEIRAVPGHAGEVWAATSEGLMRSRDHGAGFEHVAGPQVAHHLAFGKAAQGAAEPAVYFNGKVDGTYGLYRSDDDGGTWVRINDDQHQFGLLSSLAADANRYGRLYLGSTNRGILYGDPVH